MGREEETVQEQFVELAAAVYRKCNYISGTLSKKPYTVPVCTVFPEEKGEIGQNVFTDLCLLLLKNDSV